MANYDPICGKKVVSPAPQNAVEYKRRKYFFCSAKCRASFERETERLRVRELARAGALLSRGKVRWGRA